jgi:hypothetical protein
VSSVERWYRWTGGDYTPELMAFLRQQGDVIFWAEEQLLDPGAVLAISYELSQEHPIRVPPGWWLHFDGKHISAFEKGPDGE